MTVSEMYDVPGSLLWSDSSSRKSIQLWMSEVLLNQKYSLEKGFPSSSLYLLRVKGTELPGRFWTIVWSGYKRT